MDYFVFFFCEHNMGRYRSVTFEEEAVLREVFRTWREAAVEDLRG